jgi:hypothetical protein
LDENPVRAIGYEKQVIVMNLDRTRQRILAEFVDPQPWTSILAP